MTTLVIPKLAESRVGALGVTHVVLSLDVGGLERVVLNLARESESLGQNVSVLCLERFGVLGEQAKAAGLRIESLTKQPGLTPRLVDDIRAALRDLRPDVIHTHQIGALLYTGPAAKKERVPVILHTEHINQVVKSRTWSRRMRNRLLWAIAGRHAGRFCCVSQDIADSARYWVRPGKLCVVENGVPTAGIDDRDYRAETRASLTIPMHAPVVGIVARLNEVKCQDLLIRAFSNLRSRHARAHLLLVGDGPTRNALTDLTAQLGLTDVVHFAGYQPQPERYLDAMDIFVLPSRLEGMPLAILEAWAARLPVIASRVGGVPNVVRDGVDGLLFESGDQRALESHLNRLLEDADLRNKLASAGRAHVEADYGTRRMAADYHKLYLDAMPREHAVAGHIQSA
jgi:glycosyltransferase involved in cell wall biosynthesis